MPAPNTKYELRSSEVQEVMNKPPAFFISWGNLIIMLVIAAAVMVISTITVSVTARLPGTIRATAAPGNTIAVAVSVPLSSDIQKGQRVRISLVNPGYAGMGRLEGTIDAVVANENEPGLLIHAKRNTAQQLLTDNNRVLLPGSGDGCTIEIVTGHRSLLRSLLNKLGGK